MLIEKAFAFRQMPSGRHAFALSLIATLARTAGLTQTANQAEQTVAQAYIALELEQMWLSVRANKSRARGNSKELDAKVDEQISALEQRLRAETKGDANDPTVKMAHELLKQLYPEGVRGVTHKPLEVQQGEVDIILKRLDGEFNLHVRELGLERQVERIRTYNDDLRAEMAFQKALRVKHTDVIAAQKLLHNYTCKTVATLFFELSGDDPQTLALHTKILAPLADQQHRVLLARRHKTKAADINPKTGHDIPEPVPSPGE